MGAETWIIIHRVLHSSAGLTADVNVVLNGKAELEMACRATNEMQMLSAQRPHYELELLQLSSSSCADTYEVERRRILIRINSLLSGIFLILFLPMFLSSHLNKSR